jgi:hypothetical protein
VTTHFLNVDLEVVATVDLDPLVHHLAGAAFVLRDENDHRRRLLWIELEEHTDSTVDGTLRRFIELLSTLPPPLRALWDACDDRCLNIGIQSGQTPHCIGYRVDAATVAGLAAISTTLEITVYGVLPGGNV